MIVWVLWLKRGCLGTIVRSVVNCMKFSGPRETIENSTTSETSKNCRKGESSDEK